MRKTAIYSWRLEKYLLCKRIVSQSFVQAFFYAAAPFLCLSSYQDHEFCNCSCSWFKLLLFTARDSLRHEHYRSQHVGTGRMWLPETMWQGDRSPKNCCELPRPAVWWTRLICWIILTYIGFGVFKSKHKFELLHKHLCFWMINHS